MLGAAPRRHDVHLRPRSSPSRSLGIGSAAALYAFLRSGAARRSAASRSRCALEAAAIAIPFALGDRLALLALAAARRSARSGFAGHVIGWTLRHARSSSSRRVRRRRAVPAADRAARPRARGRRRATVGAAYAWNTAGAIVGSLAGGFGLLPLLTAPGALAARAWRSLALLGIAALVAAHRAARRRIAAVATRHRAFAALAAPALRTDGGVAAHAASARARATGDHRTAERAARRGCTPSAARIVLGARRRREQRRARRRRPTSRSSSTARSTAARAATPARR